MSLNLQLSKRILQVISCSFQIKESHALLLIVIRFYHILHAFAFPQSVHRTSWYHEPYRTQYAASFTMPILQRVRQTIICKNCNWNLRSVSMMPCRRTIYDRRTTYNNISPLHAIFTESRCWQDINLKHLSVPVASFVLYINVDITYEPFNLFFLFLFFSYCKRTSWNIYFGQSAANVSARFLY